MGAFQTNKQTTIGQMYHIIILEVTVVDARSFLPGGLVAWDFEEHGIAQAVFEVCRIWRFWRQLRPPPQNYARARIPAKEAMYS